MLKTVLAVTLAVALASPVYAQQASKPPCDPAKLPEFWSCPGEPPLRDEAKEDLIRSQNNRFAYNPDKPVTAAYLVLGPLAGALLGLAAVELVTSAPVAKVISYTACTPATCIVVLP